MFGPVVVAGPAHESRVALTFDDGPNPPYTERIVAALNARGARATFFVVGRAALEHPQTLRRIIAGGSEVASHGWDHRRLDMVPSRAALDMQFESTSRAIERATGMVPRLFRPPHGVRNFAVVDSARRHGERVVLWSEPLAGDWRAPASPEIVARVLARVRDGDILALHDGDRGLPCAAASCDRSATAQGVEPIVAALQRRGFALVTVSELLQPVKRTVARLAQ